MGRCNLLERPQGKTLMLSHACEPLEGSGQNEMNNITTQFSLKRP